MDELQEAFELGTQSEDPELRFTVHEEMVDRLQFTGRLPAAAALGDAYVELGRALAPDTIVRRLPVAWSIARRAWVWLEMGRLDAAADSLRECDVTLRGRGQTEPEAQTVILLARHRVFVGDGPAAVSFAKRAADVAESTGSNLTRVWAHEYLGVALALNGEWRAAVEQLELALGIARETRAWLTLEAEILAYLAEAFLGAGDAVRARRTAEEAIATARRRGTPVWEAQAQLVLARVLLARLGAQARDAIESALGSCLSLIEQTEARVYEPHVHEVRAELARLLGDEAAHDRELREAHLLFSAMGATGHAERMAGQLGSKGEHTLLILDPA
jgi:tetratricopeptide (TPR) repeat protein